VMRGHMHAARMALQAVLVRAEAGQQLISDELLDAVRYYAFLLTWKLQDCVAMVATFPEVEHLLPAAVLGAAERDVNTSAAMLRSFRRR
ncbi:MAG: hypothetical protein KAI24_10510, partial [Planctomycetes bacterium]|nr:hypothetical protein [Planctomycetota bacterium]